MSIQAIQAIQTIAPKLSAVEKCIQRGASSSFVQNMIKKQAQDPNFYPNFVLGLIVLQNLIGTITYTYASWNNKGMPKEQRKFAAAIDLMNGIFNFGIILTLGRLINNNSDKWAEIVAKPFKNLKQMENYHAAMKGFRSFLTIVVAGVFVQRVIVPFLSTPCAKWFKDKYLNKNSSKNNSQKVSYKGHQDAQQTNLNSNLASSNIDKTNPFFAFEMFQNHIK